MPIDWPNTEVRVSNGTARFGRLRWEPTYQWTRHMECFDIWLVWAGQGTFQIGEEKIELFPGRLLWMRPNCTYSAVHDPNNRLGLNYLHFDLHPRPPEAEVPTEVIDLWDWEYADSVMRRVFDLMCMMEEAQANSLLKGLLVDLEARSRNQTVAGKVGTERLHLKVVMELAEKIRESPGERMDIGKMAQSVGYSEDHFVRLFKSILGMTPHAYVVQERLSRAKYLLAESTLTIAQIADALGYNDAYFFSRQFRQNVGCTPSAYRRGERQ